MFEMTAILAGLGMILVLAVIPGRGASSQLLLVTATIAVSGGLLLIDDPGIDGNFVPG